MKAAIDIGTNSVLLLIGEPKPDGTIRTAVDRAEGTRLGEGLAESGSISDVAADRTMAVLADYMRLCDEHAVTGIACVGTAAFRGASNADDFIMLAKRSLGLNVEIISSEREAELTYLACERDFGSEIVVLDIGGGSTELIARDPKGSELEFLSLPLGCVSLLESFIEGDPVRHDELVRTRAHIREILERDVDPKVFGRPNDREFVATAGTATTLMAIDLALERYSADAVHGSTLAIANLRDMLDDLMSKTLEERRAVKGLPPQRADVIITGAAILHEAMSYLGYSDVVISDRGVKWGLFYERFGKIDSDTGY